MNQNTCHILVLMVSTPIISVLAYWIGVRDGKKIERSKKK
jgi:hypothetical protein